MKTLHDANRRYTSEEIIENKTLYHRSSFVTLQVVTSLRKVACVVTNLPKVACVVTNLPKVACVVTNLPKVACVVTNLPKVACVVISVCQDLYVWPM